MTNNRYILAIDPSGRATCRGKCKTKIEKGVVRFGSIAVAREWDGDMTYWRNLGCMTARVCNNALDAYGSVSAIPGYHQLDDSQQKHVQEVFTACLDGTEVPSGTPQKKTTDKKAKNATPKKPARKAEKSGPKKTIDKKAKTAKAEKAAATRKANKERAAEAQFAAKAKEKENQQAAKNSRAARAAARAAARGTACVA